MIDLTNRITNLIHWNYFIAIDADLDLLARFVEFAPENFSTYSVEMARLLMTATQEIDVLMKQICAAKGQQADNELGYRTKIPQLFPKLPQVTVTLARSQLSFQPFSAWSTGTTPPWWTANNKVKHERHSSFQMANLEHTLSAVSGLMIANLYFLEKDGKVAWLFPSPRNVTTPELATGGSYSPWGASTQYTLPR